MCTWLYLRGGGGLRVRNYEEKFFICPSVSLFNIFVQWSFNVDQFTCELFTVTWLKIQSKWLLSGAWFYALNSSKIVCRPGSARARWGSMRSPSSPSWIMGKGEMEGQEERERKREEERKREGYHPNENTGGHKRRHRYGQHGRCRTTFEYKVQQNKRLSYIWSRNNLSHFLVGSDNVRQLQRKTNELKWCQDRPWSFDSPAAASV